MPYDDDIRPAGVIRGTWTWFPAALTVLAAVLILGGGFTLAAWQMGWWFASHSATRQAEVTQNGYSNQTTLRQQVTTQLAAVTSLTTQLAEAGKDQSMVAALKAQRMSIGGIVCQDASQITGTPLPPQQAQWVSGNCLDGSVSPNSPIYQAGKP